jgi:hypothetical protein
MTQLHLISGLIISGILLSQPTFADDEMAVDQADSFDLESFHQDNTPSDMENPKSNWFSRLLGKKQNDRNTTTEIHTVSATFQLNPSTDAAHMHMPQYNATTVIQPLTAQMALTCPGGWIKLQEQSKAVSHGFELSYSFQCLE